MTKVRKTLIALLGVVCAVALSFGVYELMKTPDIEAFADSDDGIVCYNTDDVVCPRCTNVMTTIVLEPTCQYDGYTTYFCTTCFYSYRDSSSTTQALGHKYEVDEVAAGCETDGYYISKCSQCGDVEEEYVIPATGHDWVDVVTSPTCDEQGYTTYTCANCAAAGVDPDSYTVRSHNLATRTTDPTCTTYGWTETYCTYSDCEYSIMSEWVDPLGHSYRTETVAPSVDNPIGYTIYTCTRCGDSYLGDWNMSGNDSYLHDLSAKITVAATCETDGYSYQYCLDADCDYYIVTDWVTAYGHNYSYVDQIYPTCETPGYYVKQCKNSGCTNSTDYEVYADAIGHNYVFGTVYTDPNTRTITASYCCKNCNDDKSQYLVVSFISDDGNQVDFMGIYGTLDYSSVPDGSYRVEYWLDDVLLHTTYSVKIVTGVSDKDDDEGAGDVEEKESEPAYTLDVVTNADGTIQFSYISDDGNDKTSLLQIQLVDEAGTVVGGSLVNGALDLNNYNLTGSVVCTVYCQGETIDIFTIAAQGSTGTGSDAESSDTPSSDTGSDTGTGDVPSTGTGSDTGTDTGTGDGSSSTEGTGSEGSTGDDEPAAGGSTSGSETPSGDTSGNADDEEGSSATALIVIIVIIVVLIVALIVYFVLAKMGIFGKNKKKATTKNEESDDEAENDDDSSDDKEDEEENDEEDYE